MHLERNLNPPLRTLYVVIGVLLLLMHCICMKLSPVSRSCCSSWSEFFSYLPVQQVIDCYAGC